MSSRTLVARAASLGRRRRAAREGCVVIRVVEGESVGFGLTSAALTYASARHTNSAARFSLRQQPWGFSVTLGQATTAHRDQNVGTASGEPRLCLMCWKNNMGASVAPSGVCVCMCVCVCVRERERVYKCVRRLLPYKQYFFLQRLLRTQHFFLQRFLGRPVWVHASEKLHTISSSLGLLFLQLWQLANRTS